MAGWGSVILGPRHYPAARPPSAGPEKVQQSYPHPPTLSSAVTFRMPPDGTFTYSLSRRSLGLLMTFIAKRRQGVSTPSPTRRSHR